MAWHTLQGQGGLMDPPHPPHRATRSHGTRDWWGWDALESPTSHLWRSYPTGCSYLQPWPAWHSRAPSMARAHSGSSSAEEVPGGVRGCHRLCWQSEGVGGLLSTFPVGSQLSLPLGVK